MNWSLNIGCLVIGTLSPFVIYGQVPAIEVDSTKGVAVDITHAEMVAIKVSSSGGHGIDLGHVEKTGLYVDKAKLHGVQINQADGFGIYARGTQGAAYFDGQVGIGTQSPTRQFHVHSNLPASSNFLKITNNSTGATSSDGMDIGIEGNGDAIIWMKENSSLKLATNNSSRMTILNDGKIGIGTSAPINTLEVLGAASNGVAGFIRNDLGGSKSHILHGSSGDWYIRPSLSAGKVVIADNGGNVGIGTNSPTAQLDVNGDIHTTGEVNRPSTGSANLVPICYGLIKKDGTILGGTGNFSVTLGNNCAFIISIDNVVFAFDDGQFAVLATAQSSGTTSYNAIGVSDLLIFSQGPLATCSTFSFMVYQL